MRHAQRSASSSLRPKPPNCLEPPAAAAAAAAAQINAALNIYGRLRGDGGIICRKCYNGAENQNGGGGASPSQSVSQSIASEEGAQHKMGLAAAAAVRAIGRASERPYHSQAAKCTQPPPPLMPIKRE